jgi:putative hemolysin
MILILQGAMLVFLMIASAFFSGMETGMISINRLRLRHLVRRRVPGAALVQSFLDRPDELLGATLVGNNICHVAVSVTMVSLFTRWLGPAGPSVAGVFATLLLLVFGEYLPKAWFAAVPARRVLPFATVFRWTALVLGPIARVVIAATRALIPVRADMDGAVKTLVTREELVHLTSETQQSGQLSRNERRMIHAIFGLRGRVCREIMVPRDRLVTIRQNTPIGELLDMARSRSVNRFPVYRPEDQSFIGTVHVLDILKDPDHASRAVSEYVRPPQFIEGTTPVELLLPRMRMTREPYMMVTDERGEVIGLVTLNDVVNEVVGSPPPERGARKKGPDG